MLVCLNGHFIPQEVAHVAVNDGAFLYGDSLFETIKAKNQQILLQKQHLDRLELSARLLDIPCPRKKIETALRQLSGAFQTPLTRIRLTLSRGSFSGLQFPTTDKAWFLITATPLAELDEQQRQAGIACCIAPNRRVNPLSHLPQLKRGNYADCLYARNFAIQQGVDEALFVNPRNHLLEGATGNLFALIGKRLVTPPAGRLVLKGIMRQQLMAAASELGILTVERPLLLSEALTADEVFLSNSLIDIQPIRSIDQHQLARGELWNNLLKTLYLRIAS